MSIWWIALLAWFLLVVIDILVPNVPMPASRIVFLEEEEDEEQEDQEDESSDGGSGNFGSVHDDEDNEKQQDDYNQQ